VFTEQGVEKTFAPREGMKRGVHRKFTIRRFKIHKRIRVFLGRRMKLRGEEGTSNGKKITSIL
jgi:hypothetical protein